MAARKKSSTKSKRSYSTASTVSNASKRKTVSKSKSRKTSTRKTSAGASKIKATTADKGPDFINLKPADKKKLSSIQGRFNRLKMALADLAMQEMAQKQKAERDKGECLKGLQAVKEEMIATSRTLAESYGIDINGDEKWSLDLETLRFYKPE